MLSGFPFILQTNGLGFGRFRHALPLQVREVASNEIMCLNPLMNLTKECFLKLHDSRATYNSTYKFSVKCQ